MYKEFYETVIFAGVLSRRTKITSLLVQLLQLRGKESIKFFFIKQRR